MALGLPDTPPYPLEDFEEASDEYCPHCGWDSDSVNQDYQAAYGNGILLAVEAAESSPFTMMGAAQPYAFYWRCGGNVPADASSFAEGVESRRCGRLFSTEIEDVTFGAMA
jgi:hypothetical protein